MQKQLYKIADKSNSRKIAEFLSKDGQLLLPFLKLVCNTEQAVDELIDVAGKVAIEAVLVLSRSPAPNSRAGPKVTSTGMAGKTESFHCRSESFVSKNRVYAKRAKAAATK